MLTFDTAARIATYSSIGNAKSWKLGLDWKVYEDLRLRATKSSALRAPNIGELYGEASQTFFRVSDPCRTDNLADLANADQPATNDDASGTSLDQQLSAHMESVQKATEAMQQTAQQVARQIGGRMQCSGS